jgi:hypothetical protein
MAGGAAETGAAQLVSAAASRYNQRGRPRDVASGG